MLHFLTNNNISEISLSRLVVGRRIEEVTHSNEESLIMKAAKFKSSAAADEMTDVSDTAQLVLSFVESTWSSV
jgi:hypothetical protein